MLNQLNLKSLCASLLLLSFAAVGSQAQNQTLSECEAVRLAEQFIARNGYTDVPADKSRLAHENIEWESNVDKMLKERRDTLEREAYGIVRKRKGAPGWTVVFRYKHPSTQQMRRKGRAVTMNMDGSYIRVEHVDIMLRSVDEKL